MKNLKYSAPDWCFFREGDNPDEYYAKIKSAGYFGVEMVAPERMKSARDAGLEIINIAGPGVEFGMNNRANHEKLISEMLNVVEEATHNNISYIIVFSGNTVAGAVEQGFENCVEGYSKLLEKMRGSNVKLSFEMFNAVDHVGYQADNEEFGFNLAKALNNPNFTILYDVYHMVKSGGNLLEDFETKLPFISHFHVANLENRTIPKIDGTIDYKSIVRALQIHDFKGCIGMEFCSSNPKKDMCEAVEIFDNYL